MNQVGNIRVLDVAKALAFIGDLSMGQPTDHSLRTAWLATQLAEECGFEAGQHRAIKNVSLLRWSGCTANAHGFSELLGNDIAGREALLARREGSEISKVIDRGDAGLIAGLAEIHCEVSGDIARMLSLDSDTEAALRNIFESYDATGWPNKRAGALIPPAAFAVSLAGDLEILSRAYGIDQALTILARDANLRFPAELVERVQKHGRAWHAALEHDTGRDFDDFLSTHDTMQVTSPQLIADVIDLKLPWMTRYSQRVADACAACCNSLGLDDAKRDTTYRAGLIHGMGRASVPNAIWARRAALPASAWEKIRLVPYWTKRAGITISAMRAEVDVASFAYERLDESGYFRGADASAMNTEARILSAAVAWIAMQSPRPWRAAMSLDQASVTLSEQAQAGRFDREVVEALVSGAAGDVPKAAHRLKPVALSAREVEVLREISQGLTNKEVARVLDVSASTVRTHVESVFRKLDCTTRAAATLKASAMGLL